MSSSLTAARSSSNRYGDTRPLDAPDGRSRSTLAGWNRTGDGWTCERRISVNHRATSCEDIYSALIVGLRDYVEKNGFPGIVLGLSGGIDSALSAAVAVDALGPERVLGVRLPRHSPAR